MTEEKLVIAKGIESKILTVKQKLRIIDTALEAKCKITVNTQGTGFRSEEYLHLTDQEAMTTLMMLKLTNQDTLATLRKELEEL